MFDLLLAQLPFAQSGRLFDSLRSDYQGRSQFGPRELIIYGASGLVAVFAIWLLAWLARRGQRIRRFDSPRGLFDELCRAHQLSRRTRRQVRKLARGLFSEHPARLFLEPDALDADGWAKQLGLARDEAVDLRRRLYGDVLADLVSLRRRVAAPSELQGQVGESPDVDALPPLSAPAGEVVCAALACAPAEIHPAEAS